MKEKFSADEWNVLMMMPAMVLHMIVLTDGEMSEEERVAVSKDLAIPEATKNELHRELLVDFGKDPATNLQASIQLIGDLDKVFGVCGAALRANLTGKEYQSFLASLMVSALMIAGSDGLHKDEADVINAFGNAFEVDPAALKAEMALYS